MMTSNNHNEPSQNSGVSQKIKTVTKDEFVTIDFESPLANSTKVDCVTSVPYTERQPLVRRKQETKLLSEYSSY